MHYMQDHTRKTRPSGPISGGRRGVESVPLGAVFACPRFAGAGVSAGGAKLVLSATCLTAGPLLRFFFTCADCTACGLAFDLCICASGGFQTSTYRSAATAASEPKPMHPAMTASTTFEENVDKADLTTSAPESSVSASARKYSVQRALRCVEFKQRAIQPLQRQRDCSAARAQFRFAARSVKSGRYRAGSLHVSRERSSFSRRMTVHVSCPCKSTHLYEYTVMPRDGKASVRQSAVCT
jgi:hypothetical protein